MNKLIKHSVLTAAFLSISLVASAKTLPFDELPRIKSIENQLDGALVELNIVNYGGGVIYLPVIKSEKEMCVSIISTMRAISEHPKKASDYEYKVAVHCDEIIEEELLIRGKPIFDENGNKKTRSKPKGFERFYNIELENGVVMHSIKFNSGTLRVWPTNMYSDWMNQNDKSVVKQVAKIEKAKARYEKIIQERQGTQQ